MKEKEKIKNSYIKIGMKHNNFSHKFTLQVIDLSKIENWLSRKQQIQRK